MKTLALIPFLLAVAVPVRADETVDRFAEGIAFCSGAVLGNPLGLQASRAGWDRTPLVANSFQKDGVRAFHSGSLAQCHVQTSKRPANLRDLEAALNRLVPEKLGLRRVAWAQARKRPLLNDDYRQWRWDVAATGGVINFEVNELPGALTDRPREQALTATVTFNKGAQFMIAVPRTLGPAPAPSTTGTAAQAEYERIFISLTKACEREMRMYGYGQGTAVEAAAKADVLTKRGRHYEWARDGRVVSIERRGAGPCKVIARGATMDVAHVRDEIARFLTSETPAYIEAERITMSIPEMGPRFDHWITPFERRTKKSISRLNLQENRWATVAGGPGDYAMVSTADHYETSGFDMEPEGPFMTALIESMALCAITRDQLGLSMIRGRMKHVRDEIDNEIGRVLDEGLIRFSSSSDWIGCTMEIHSRPQDDWLVKRAFERWLSWKAKNVQWKARDQIATESGFTWYETKVNASLGDTRRGLQFNLHSENKLGGETGPRFVFQSMVPFY
jgi:hypothetical protein